jgi:hypothetical protein
MALDDLDLAGVGPATQNGGYSMRTVELLAARFEEVVNFTSGQRFLDLGLREHRPNPLELVPAELHTYATFPRHIIYRQTGV